MNTVANERSTCEWVDEAYSKRLWGQLLRRADSQPAGARRCLLTVRRYAIDRWKSGGPRAWTVTLLIPAPGRALDLVVAQYTRDGHYIGECTFMRISGHAGERLFERLRTNADEDLLDTVKQALVIIIQGGAANVRAWQAEHQQHSGIRVNLPWGHLILVPDEGLWVAKTFIPGAKK